MNYLNRLIVNRQQQKNIYMRPIVLIIFTKCIFSVEFLNFLLYFSVFRTCKNVIQIKTNAVETLNASTIYKATVYTLLKTVGVLQDECITQITLNNLRLS